MDRLGFLKKSVSLAMDAANSVMGFKKATDEISEAVEDVFRGVKADIGLYLQSVDAAMYDSPSGTLYEISQMGYTTLEVGSYYDGKVYYAGAEKFKEMVRRDSLRVSALRINKPYQKPQPAEEPQPVEGEAPTEEHQPTEGKAPADEWLSAEHKEWLTKAVSTAKRLGSSYLTMANFPDEPIASQIEGYAKYYNLIGSMCKEKGLKLCLHPSKESLEKHPEGSIFERIMLQCDKDVVCVCADTLELHRAEVPYREFFEQYKGRVPMLHIHDYGIVGESEKIDFDAIIACGESCGVEKIYIEVTNCTLPAMNCLERSIYKIESLASVKF
jgi:sugar phosphate isomerase/epimerase